MLAWIRILWRLNLVMKIEISRCELQTDRDRNWMCVMENARLTHTHTHQTKWNLKQTRVLHFPISPILSFAFLVHFIIVSGILQIVNISTRSANTWPKFNYTPYLSKRQYLHSDWMKCMFVFSLTLSHSRHVCVCAHKRLLCCRVGAAFGMCDLRVFEKKYIHIEIWVFSQFKFKLKLYYVISHCSYCSLTHPLWYISMMYREFFPASLHLATGMHKITAHRDTFIHKTAQHVLQPLKQPCH